MLNGYILLLGVGSAASQRIQVSFHGKTKEEERQKVKHMFFYLRRNKARFYFLLKMLSSLSSVLRRAPAARALQCARCASSLVLGEYGAGGVSNATRAAVTAAGKLGGPIHVLLAGVGAKAAAASAAQVAGVSKVLYSEEPAVSHGMAEGLALLLQALLAQGSECGRAAAARAFARAGGRRRRWLAAPTAPLCLSFLP